MMQGLQEDEIKEQKSQFIQGQQERQNSQVHPEVRSIGLCSLLRAIIPFAVSSNKIPFDHDKEYIAFFCEKQKWLSQSDYYQISEMAYSLFGASPAQSIVAVVAITTRSVFLSVIGFIFFCLPSALCFLLMAYLTEYPQWIMLNMAQIMNVSETQRLAFYDLVTIYFKLCLLGAQVGSATILFTHFLKQYKSHCYTNAHFSILLILFTCAIMLYHPAENSLKLSIVLVLLLTMYVKIEPIKARRLHRNILHELKKSSIFFGNFSVYLMLIMIATLWVLCTLLSNALLELAWNYFFIGLIVYGSGHSLIGILYIYMVNIHNTHPYVFWLVIPSSIVIPGLTSPCLVIYFGYIQQEFFGALLAPICYYMPTFLSLFGLMLRWSKLRSTMGIQRLSIGMTCLNLGLLLYGLLQLICSTGSGEPVLTGLIFVIALVVHYMYQATNTKTILLSIMLANIRRWGMIYYRQTEFELYF